MKNKKNMRRFLSGFLALLTVLSTILSPILSYAADVVPVPEEPPLYEEVKNELDADEVVKGKAGLYNRLRRYIQSCLLCRASKWPPNLSDQS